MFKQLWKEISDRPICQGITMIDVMGLSAPLSSALMHMVRGRTLTLAEFAAELTLGAEETRLLADLMIEKGLLTAIEEPDRSPSYRVHLVSGRAHRSAARLLESLEDD
jgi:hypothetical protein